MWDTGAAAFTRAACDARHIRPDTGTRLSAGDRRGAAGGDHQLRAGGDGAAGKGAVAGEVEEKAT